MFTESYLKESLIKAEKDKVYKFYICINLEHSIFKDPDSDGYSAYPIDPYKYSIECLKYLSSRSDIKLIFVSNYDSHIKTKMFNLLKRSGINNYFVNTNKDVYNIGWSYYSKDNFYYNILLDRRSGFDPNNDWINLFNFFKKNKYSEKNNMLDLYNDIDKHADFESEILDIKEQTLNNFLEYQEKINFILNYPFKMKENKRNLHRILEEERNRKKNIFKRIFKR